MVEVSWKISIQIHPIFVFPLAANLIINKRLSIFVSNEKQLQLVLTCKGVRIHLLEPIETDL